MPGHGGQPSASAERSEAWTTGTCFEALFRRVHQPGGAYAQALKGAGLDVAALRQRYPSAVWGRCVELARQHLFPELPEAAGMRQLGARFTGAYLHTALGRFIGAGIFIVGLERTVQRIPTFWRMMCTGVEVEAQRVGPSEWHLVAHDPYNSPDFVAGAVEVGLRRGNDEVRVAVAHRTPDAFVLRIHW